MKLIEEIHYRSNNDFIKVFNAKDILLSERNGNKKMRIKQIDLYLIITENFFLSFSTSQGRNRKENEKINFSTELFTGSTFSRASLFSSFTEGKKENLRKWSRTEY